jgi:hypothetical protein
MVNNFDTVPYLCNSDHFIPERIAIADLSLRLDTPASGWSLWPPEARDDTQRTPLDIAMMLSRSNSTMSSSTNTSTTAGPGAGPSRHRKGADHIPSLTLPELSPVPLNDLEAVDRMLMRCDEAELEGVVDRERRRWEAIPEELFARPVSSGPSSPGSE